MDIDSIFGRLPTSVQKHSGRVAICMQLVAEGTPELIGWYNFRNMNGLLFAMYLGGIYHDVGKALLPQDLLRKIDRGQPLSEKETTRLRDHPRYGEALVAKYEEQLLAEDEPRKKLVPDVIRFHHERPDGKGFPCGLNEKKIPVPVGICAAANALDHFLTENVQGKEQLEAAKSYLRVNTNVLFSETVADCVESVLETIVKQYQTQSENFENPIFRRVSGQPLFLRK
jgi:HD-GYP domain-containing protein (c-di-GMP phosphodiesterase class II)